MKTSFQIVLTALLLNVFVTGQSGQGYDLANSVPRKTSEEELKQITKRMIDEPASIQKLRPTYGECRKIASDQKNALRLWSYSIEFYDLIKEEGKLPLKETPDGVTVAPVTKKLGKLNELKDKLANDYRRDKTWYLASFEKSDRSLEIFSGFTKVNGRWIFVPRFYEAFDGDKDLSPPLVVLKMFDSKMVEDLYEFCSPRLTEQIGKEQAETFFGKFGFTKIKHVDMKTQSRNQVHDRQIISQGMNVDFADGRAAAVNMIFEFNEDKDLCLAWIGMQSRIGVDTPSMFAPLPSRSRTMARGLLKQVAKAVDSGDFAEIHSKSAKSIREAMTIEKLCSLFPKENETVALIPSLDPQTLEFLHPQTLGQRDPFKGSSFSFLPQKERVPMGPLVLKTVVKTKDGQHRIGATFEFHFEDDQWKPSGYSFFPMEKQ